MASLRAADQRRSRPTLSPWLGAACTTWPWTPRPWRRCGWAKWARCDPWDGTQDSLGHFAPRVLHGHSRVADGKLHLDGTDSFLLIERA
ncbi:MAG: hypothetical protein NTY19_13400 [Planctomycetota bacterium]|nr:hypothetical protein [Planctomycetota bacterium]